ncbi:MAG: FMN-binding protein [Helcococcus sp.]|nr:FMN-binding protein [Helcococcus sp.]
MKKTSSIIVLILVIALGIGLIYGTSNLLASVEEKEGGSVSEYSDVYPDGKEFIPIEVEGDNEFNKILEVTDGSNVIGYVFDAITAGYGGDVNFRIGISKEGIVQGFQPISHNETEGFGKKIEDSEFIDGIKDVNLSTGAVSFGAGNKDNGEIVAISGATITTKAITDELIKIVNTLSKIDENIQSVEKEIPYYANKWQELFKNALHIFSFEEFMDKDIYNENFNRIIRVKNQQGEVDSYILQLSQQGFGGTINSLVRVSTDYRIFNIAFGEFNETPNYGAYADTDEYKEFVKGINLDKNLITKSIKLLKNPKHEKDLLLISGATVTSQALKSSLDAAIEGLVKFDKIKNDDSKYEAINFDELLADNAGGNNLTYDHTGFYVDETTPIEVGSNDIVKQVSEAKIDGEVVGHIFDLSTSGFAGNIEFGVLIDNDSKIKQIVIYNHNETEGFGKAIEDTSYQNSIIGKDLKSIDIFKAGDNIDNISGATYTTDGMVNALNALLESYKGL